MDLLAQGQGLQELYMGVMGGKRVSRVEEGLLATGV